MRPSKRFNAAIATLDAFSFGSVTSRLTSLV
jgi:hypothetical protein